MSLIDDLVQGFGKEVGKVKARSEELMRFL